MELRSRVFKVALAAVAGLVVVGTQVESEASGNRYLCTSAPSACEYAPPTAPSLNADVCYDGTTTVLKGASACPTGSYAYWVDAGEVIDPLTGVVQPYAALPDACDLGLCLPKDPGDPPGEEGPMCCDTNSGDCVETVDICPPDKIAVWCDDGETPIQGENGDWVCHESD